MKLTTILTTALIATASSIALAAPYEIGSGKEGSRLIFANQKFPTADFTQSSKRSVPRKLKWNFCPTEARHLAPS